MHNPLAATPPPRQPTAYLCLLASRQKSKCVNQTSAPRTPPEERSA
jgi:hypothetical protein